MSNRYEHLDDLTRPHMVAAFDAAAARGEVRPPGLMSGVGAARFSGLVREALRAGDEEGLAQTLADAALWKLYGPAPAAAAAAGLVRTNWVLEAQRVSQGEFHRWYEAGLARRQAEGDRGTPPPPAEAAAPSETPRGVTAPPAQAAAAQPASEAGGMKGARVAAGVALGVLGAGLAVAKAVWKTSAGPALPTGPAEEGGTQAAVDPAAFFRWAYEQVDSTDWTQQVIAPGDERLAGGFTRDKPDLTRSMVERYLDFHAWVWGRPPTPLERNQVTQGLGSVWGGASVHWDNRLPREVLAKLCLRHAAAQLPAREREEIRSALRRQIPDGFYTELAPAATVGATSGAAMQPATAQLAGELQASDFRTKVLVDLLRNMVGRSSAAPGFWAG